jgi:hypothetical protein
LSDDKASSSPAVLLQVSIGIDPESGFHTHWPVRSAVFGRLHFRQVLSLQSKHSAGKVHSSALITAMTPMDTSQAMPMNRYRPYSEISSGKSLMRTLLYPGPKDQDVVPAAGDGGFHS